VVALHGFRVEGFVYRSSQNDAVLRWYRVDLVCLLANTTSLLVMSLLYIQTTGIIFATCHNSPWWDCGIVALSWRPTFLALSWVKEKC
jgi:hypothetical protein